MWATLVRQPWRKRLKGNRIGDEGFQELCEAVKARPINMQQEERHTSSSLISINVGENGITDAGLGNMPCISQLEELYLDGNDITDRGALDLAKAVMGNKSMRWLNLEANPRLSWKGIETLKMFLHKPEVLDADCKTVARYVH